MQWSDDVERSQSLIIYLTFWMFHLSCHHYISILNMDGMADFVNLNKCVFSLKLDLQSIGSSPDLQRWLIWARQIQWSELGIWTWDISLGNWELGLGLDNVLYHNITYFLSCIYLVHTLLSTTLWLCQWLSLTDRNLCYWFKGPQFTYSQQSTDVVIMLKSFMMCELMWRCRHFNDCNTNWKGNKDF